MPSGFVSPRNDVALWNGSGTGSVPGFPSSGVLLPVSPPAPDSGGADRTTLSSHTSRTRVLAFTSARKDLLVETTASALILLRSVATTPPLFFTVVYIWVRVVPGAKRTTVTFHGLLDAVAWAPATDPVAVGTAIDAVARATANRILRTLGSSLSRASWALATGRRMVRRLGAGDYLRHDGRVSRACFPRCQTRRNGHPRRCPPRVPVAGPSLSSVPVTVAG